MLKDIECLEFSFFFKHYALLIFHEMKKLFVVLLFIVSSCSNLFGQTTNIYNHPTFNKFQLITTALIDYRNSASQENVSDSLWAYTILNIDTLALKAGYSSTILMLSDIEAATVLFNGNVSLIPPQAAGPCSEAFWADVAADMALAGMCGDGVLFCTAIVVAKNWAGFKRCLNNTSGPG